MKSRMWVLLRLLGGVPKTLVWDNEAGIGQHQRLTVGARSFAGTLGTRIWQAPARDPETKGVVERANGYLQTSFMPGRTFTDPADFNTQLAGWLPTSERPAGPSDREQPSRAARDGPRGDEALPPVAPRVGWSGQVRLGRDYYVRACGNDYSVCPSVIGRMVDITCDLERVQVRCAGQLVADHARSWARTLTVTDTEHVLTAKGLRTESTSAPEPPDQRPLRHARDRSWPAGPSATTTPSSGSNPPAEVTATAVAGT